MAAVTISPPQVSSMVIATQIVIAGTAAEPVVTGPPGDRIVAVATVELIVESPIALDYVIGGLADDDLRSGRVIGTV